MPLPKNVPELIEGLPRPERIDELAFQGAKEQLGVSDWCGLITWAADVVPVVYDAYINYNSDADDKYFKYGAVILGLNGGAYNAPVIGWLGMNVFDELEDRERIIPINVLISRNEPGAPFSYGTRFKGAQTTEKFLRQRFFPQPMEGFLR